MNLPERDAAACRLSESELAVLRQWIGRHVAQVVWDLNAIYCVADDRMLKIEAVVEAPPSPEPSKYDEAMCVRVSEGPAADFDEARDQDYWYKVVATDERIRGLEIARTQVLMPAEAVIAPHLPAPPGQLGTICDVGVLITLTNGVVPGVQRHNWFGFQHWPMIGIYERAEALELLGADYELIAVEGERLATTALT